MTQHIVRRFRKEIRARSDIQPNATVRLADDPRRASNTQAATLLLRDVFGERINVVKDADGLVCGSREEAGILRLQEYTRSEAASRDVLLSSLTLSDLQEYLASKQVVDAQLFVPVSPEQRFVQRLGDEFPDVLYGL